MPFIYKPSLWGYAASAIFIVLTIIELQDSSWVDAVMWGLLAFSFTVKYLPKFFIFSLPGSAVSLVTLIAGGAMFFGYAADKLSNS